MKPSIKLRLLLVLILSLILINCIYLVTPASESINVNDYIQQYNFPAIIQMYLKPLEELDQSEKEFIDLLQGLPEDKQKNYAKDVYKNKSLTPELLEKIKKEKPSEKPIVIDGKIDKITQRLENPVDIYAVIANGTDDKDLNGGPMIGMLLFYKLFKDVGVNDGNITLFLYHPNNRDFKGTKIYKSMIKYQGIPLVSKLLPSDQSNVEIDYENRKVTKTDFLKAISKIPSDNNDWVYILYSSHGSKNGGFAFPDKWMDSTELKRAIKKIDYGRLIVLQDSCHAGALLKNLEGIDNYVAIATGDEKKIVGLGQVPLLFVECFRKDHNTPIEKLIKRISDKRPDIHPPLFYSDKNLINEPFIPEGYSLN